MEEEVVRILEAKNDRLLIVKRSDGIFSYRTQRRDRAGWGRPSLIAGLYDSRETAESEARSRIWWLAAITNAENETSGGA
jgi:hypothetical protein